MFLSYRYQLLVHDLVVGLAKGRFLVASFGWSETCKRNSKVKFASLFLPLVVVEARAGLIILVIVQGPWRLLLLDEPEKGEGAFIKALSQLFWFQTYLV